MLSFTCGQGAWRVTISSAQKVVLNDKFSHGVARINGYDAFEQMRLLKPDLKVIFTSAYDAETAQLGFIDQQGLRFLQKPFESAALLYMVREVLDCEPAAVEIA